tara:strand:+ start:3067 stop:3798 length:732 start_codon:yes stop_codon:yes gene_type:complete
MTKSFPELLPFPLERFYDEFKGKKYFIVKSDKPIFSDHFSWRELDMYLNSSIGRWDRLPQLQIITPEGKYCHRKKQFQKGNRVETDRTLTREEIFDLWNQGNSFVLTLCEFLNKTMWNQCKEFEKHYGIGQANLYCSKQEDAVCFPIHADSTDNFLFHVRGSVRWYLYNEFSHHCSKEKATVKEVIDLDDGDLLYIPKKLYHRVDTLSPRISISFHFKERHGKPYKREEWYDWIGEISNGRPR